MLAIAILLRAAIAQAQKEPNELHLPLIVHLARGTDGKVASAAEVRQMVAQINHYYRGAAICFSLEEVRDVPRSADLKTYRDRHAFIAFAIPNVVNVFLVHSIYDPESSESTVRTAARFGFKPNHWLDGAHIEKPGHKPDSYAIVRFAAGADVMAHEIGHILGEGHSSEPENIMGYSANSWKFDATQLRTFRTRARRDLGSGALRSAMHCNLAESAKGI